jgi:small subunit ribosomal protein S6e
MVKINIAYPPFNTNQMIEIDDEKKWRVFLEKRLSEEVPADSLGDEFKGYVFKITGAYDKEGFAAMQGVMLNHRVRLLLDGRTGQYSPKCHGCRKKKSVRGCIIGSDMSCINVAIVKRGPADLPKLTDPSAKRPNVHGPKRANNIRKAWGLGKKEDVRQYVVKRVVPGKNGKKDRVKSPKIQRLITPLVKRRRRRLEREEKKKVEKARKEAADYHMLLKQIRAQKRVSLLSKKRGENKSRLSERVSVKEVEKKPTPTSTTKPVETKKTATPTTEKKPTGVTKPTTQKKATTTTTPKTTTPTTATKKTPETKKVVETKPEVKKPVETKKPDTKTTQPKAQTKKQPAKKTTDKK